MTLDVRTQTLNLRCGASNNDLKCIDSQEFPPISVEDLSDGLEINVADLKEMIQQVTFAASTDEARPILTGVLIKIDDDKITMAAADGFRLSVRNAPLSSSAPLPISAVIPARALSELARIVEDGDQTVTMTMPPGRGQVVFQMQNAELVSQLIEGAFPDYEQIIPLSCETRAVLSTSAFLKACKQAEIFAREGSRIARLKIEPGDELEPGTVEIQGQSEETGSSENIVDATIEGPKLLIAFNVGFLREVLDVINTPNVALETSADTSPGVIRPVEAEGEHGEFIHVIMPMHLGS
jgi:DNA polymerase-3 subunit beta